MCFKDICVHKHSFTYECMFVEYVYVYTQKYTHADPSLKVPIATN